MRRAARRWPARGRSAARRAPRGRRSRRRRARARRGRRAPCRTRPWPAATRSDRHAGRPRAPRAAGLERVAVADPDGRPRGRAVSAWRAPPSAATTQRAPARASRARRRRARRAVPTSPSARTIACMPAMLRRMPAGADADARLRAVPDPLDHPADPARPRRRRAQGRDPRGDGLRRVDPHGRGGRRGGRRRARPDREVAGLRGPDATTGPEPIVCLVSGPNRVDVARLAAVTGEPDIRRATAREANELTGFIIGGIPPIGHARPTARDHGPGPRPLPDRLGGGRPADRGLPGPAGDAADARQRDGRPDRRGRGRGRETADATPA